MTDFGKEREGVRFQHDCQLCTFLGTYKEYDLYFCDKGHSTVIARKSHEPSDYLSGMVFAVRNEIEPLRVALTRAIEKGLCDENGKPKH